MINIHFLTLNVNVETAFGRVPREIGRYVDDLVDAKAEVARLVVGNDRRNSIIVTEHWCGPRYLDLGGVARQHEGGRIWAEVNGWIFII